MKKVILVLLVFAVVCGSAFAVDFDILSYPSSLKGGDILVDLGIGYAGWGSTIGGKTKIPPLIVSGEYCLPVGLPISVGGMFSISSYTWEWNDPTYTNPHKTTYTYLIFAPRGNWHWGFDIDWLDLYTGVSTGYRHFFWKYNGPNADYFSRYHSWNYGGFYIGTQLGAHFYITNFIGANVEFGWPIYAKAAVSLKF